MVNRRKLVKKSGKVTGSGVVLHHGLPANMLEKVELAVDDIPILRCLVCSGSACTWKKDDGGGGGSAE